MAVHLAPTIEVPPDEVVRQAEAALLGYSYQLYQTVSAWLSLRPNEFLHIEFAEDFAVSDEGTLKLTQVKNTKSVLSLRSKAVAALIRAVWTFQVANPNRSVQAALITTGRIVKEKGLLFPGKTSGLSYWRVAARDQADIEPIRAVLLELDLPADLRAFLKDGGPDDIRQRILRPIRWLGSGLSQDEIELDLHEQLVHFGNAQGVGAQDSKNALNALIVELLMCVRKPAVSRYVTAADLLTVFLAALRQRTVKGGLLTMETTLASRLVQAAVRDINVDRFIDVLAIYPRAVVEGVAIMKRRDYTAFAMPTGLLKPIAIGEWGEEAIREATASVVLIFMLTAASSGRLEVVEDSRARLSERNELAPALAPLFETISEPFEGRDDVIVIAANILGRLIKPSFVFDAAEAFMATVHLVQLLSGHVLGETAAGPIFEYFANVWRDILTNRTFSVRNPAATAPFILVALSKGDTNCAKLANLVLASEAAVRAVLVMI